MSYELINYFSIVTPLAYCYIVSLRLLFHC